MALDGQNDGVTVGESKVAVGERNTGYSGSRWTERRGNCRRE